MPVVVYVPTLNAPDFFGSEVTNDLEAFKAGCDEIAANRWSTELADVTDQVYTRNLFKRVWGRVAGRLRRARIASRLYNCVEDEGLSANADRPSSLLRQINCRSIV